MNRGCMTCEICIEFSVSAPRPFFGTEDRIIASTERFVATPGVGPQEDGYVLIWSRDHVFSMARLSSHLAELLGLVDRLGSMIEGMWGPFGVFEHGATPSDASGGCISHAHWHLFQTRPSLEDELLHGVNHWDEIDILELGRYQDDPYVLFRGAPPAPWLLGCSDVRLKSQYLRRAIARDLGSPDDYDWALHMDVERMRRTLEQLRCEPIE